MQTSKLILALLTLVLVSADKPKLTEVDADDVGTRISILGRLGVPIGEVVTITGEKVRAGKTEEISFFVNAVNGQPLKERTTVRIKGIIDWPLGTKAEIRGQEKGTITFTDIRATGFGFDDTGFVLKQTIYLSFDADKVVAPRNLTLKVR